MLEHFSSFFLSFSAVTTDVYVCVFFSRRHFSRLYALSFMINLPLIDWITNASKAHLTSPFAPKKSFWDTFFSVIILWMRQANHSQRTTKPLSRDYFLTDMNGWCVCVFMFTLQKSLIFRVRRDKDLLISYFLQKIFHVANFRKTFRVYLYQKTREREKMWSTTTFYCWSV